MPPNPLHDLPTLVQQKYDAAKASSSLTFSHTDLTTIPVANIPFQLRFCPALSQKPISSNSKQPADANGAHSSVTPPTTAQPDPDPFASPPPALLIAQLPPPHPPSEPTHILVLNKYPVIASHFILATKPFKRQTDLLEPDDLSVTFACLRGWESGQHSGAGAGSEGKRLFAFFNSGERSGASQAHRHVQFLPVEEMGGGVDKGGWKPLVDWMENGGAVDGDSLNNLHSLPQLPFIHFALPIPPDPSPEQLYDRYRRLYGMAVGSCRRYVERHPEEEDILVGAGGRDEGAAVISYNLALTTSRMVICPRRSEGAMLKGGGRHGSRSLGPVAINGTVLGGTLMVKTEEEWDELRRDEAGLYGLLQAVGIPIEHSPGNANGRL